MKRRRFQRADEEQSEESERLYREIVSFSNLQKEEEERSEKEKVEELKELRDRLYHEQESFSKFVKAEKERLEKENAEFLLRVEGEKADLVNENKNLLQQIATFGNLAARKQEIDHERASLQEHQQDLIAARGKLVQDQNVLELHIASIVEREVQLIVNETLLGTKEQATVDERKQWHQQCDQQKAIIREREDQIAADGNSLRQLEDALIARRTQYRCDLADLRNGQRALEVDRQRRNMLPSLSHNQQGDTSLGVSAFASLVLLGFYMIFVGLIVYRCFPGFSSREGGNPFVDSFYMTSVTTFTVGYGDIYPQESNTTILCDMIVMLGHFMPIILYDSLGRIARTLDRKFLSTVESEKRRLGYRVVAAICAIFVAIFSGMVGIYVFERDRLASGSPSPVMSPSLSPSAMPPTSAYTHLGFRDMFHLLVMSVSTAGYGDVTFVTIYGRAFAALWIPFAALWIPFAVTLYSVAMTLLTESIVCASARRSMTGHS